MTDFPQWGFWIVGSDEPENVTHRRHLFLEEEKTACGFSPIKESMLGWLRYRFSAHPKIDGINEVRSQLARGRGYRAEDFPKCKRCLKKEEK